MMILSIELKLEGSVSEKISTESQNSINSLEIAKSRLSMNINNFDDVKIFKDSKKTLHDAIENSVIIELYNEDIYLLVPSKNAIKRNTISNEKIIEFIDSLISRSKNNNNRSSSHSSYIASTKSQKFSKDRVSIGSQYNSTPMDIFKSVKLYNRSQNCALSSIAQALAHLDHFDLNLINTHSNKFEKILEDLLSSMRNKSEEIANVFLNELIQFFFNYDNLYKNPNFYDPKLLLNHILKRLENSSPNIVQGFSLNVKKTYRVIGYNFQIPEVKEINYIIYLGTPVRNLKEYICREIYSRFHNCKESKVYCDYYKNFKTGTEYNIIESPFPKIFVIYLENTNRIPLIISENQYYTFQGMNYTLSSVLSITGTNGLHYFITCKEGDIWVKYNDAAIEIFKENSIETPYLLFYTR